MNASHEMSHDEISRARLALLRREHRDLDEAIAALAGQALTQSLTLQRLKKQKLALKDRIARLEDELTPDIIA
ncbi:YdcH family protein [Paracoccus jiaweipingae]|uniref:YdcH family protein n=1 Tax=unclassified Paracoccus (in: a-proteobacteria) TaxID=2688777 RepID=UPI00378D1B86